jgi:hypothetical protein
MGSVGGKRDDLSRSGAVRSEHGAEVRALLAGTTVLVLTTVHHVHGAVLYQTPERYHAVFIAVGAFVLLLGALVSSRRSGASAAGHVAWWTFWGISAAVPVLLFGMVEGLYNHVVKVALYFGGAPASTMETLFPSSIYEMPDDAVFEVTGVLQFPAGLVTAYFLFVLLRRRRFGHGRPANAGR